MAREAIAPEKLDEYLKTLSKPGPLEAAVNWYRANSLGFAEVPTVSIPTLYVWGTADGTVGRRAAELTKQFVTGEYRFMQIDGGGHFVVDQFAARIVELLISHLRDNPFSLRGLGRRLDATVFQIRNPASGAGGR